MGGPFGLVMIESLACGTPVIAFRKGSVPELLIHGQVGFVVDTLEEMCQAVRNVHSISARACRDYVELNFNGKLMAERYLEVYERTIQSWSIGRSNL
jgi:glycosyltransferase involved in cell wall biosynthesis